VKLEAACVKKFSRHETFAPRYLWPKKAYDSCSDSPELFNTDQGLDELIEKLAVGKSMVKSIRYWGQAFRIFTEEKQKGKRKLIRPTAIGETFFGDDGWDPYCEHPDTLWLLHWWLLAPGSFAPSWWLAFNKYTGLKFTADELEQFIMDCVTNWQPARASVKKDVRCLIQMYASGHSARATFDDQLDHPFRDLDLLSPSDREPGVYRFLIGPKVTLAPEVAAFACLDFVARTQTRSKTVNMSRLASEPGSPGKVFNLTETALADLLETAASSRNSQFALTSAAGVSQVALDDDPADIAKDLLWDHYRTFVDDCKAPSGYLAGPEADRGVRLTDAP
jgi:hypothetical protein